MTKGTLYLDNSFDSIDSLLHHQVMYQYVAIVDCVRPESLTLNSWRFSTIRFEYTLRAFFSCLQPHAVVLEMNLYASEFTILLMRL